MDVLQPPMVGETNLKEADINGMMIFQPPKDRS